MLQGTVHIFVLDITGRADERFIQVPFSAYVDHLEFFQKPRKNAAHSLVYFYRAEAAADDKDDRSGC